MDHIYCSTPSRGTRCRAAGLAIAALLGLGCKDVPLPTAPTPPEANREIALAVNPDEPLQFFQVSTGFDHTCGVTLARDLYCWGNGESGKLGTGSTQAESRPTHVFPTARFQQVSAGRSHTCAILVNPTGIAWCWGLNESGQLGDGTTASRLSANPVWLELEQHPLRFRSVSAGGSHTCGVTTTGLAVCWGRNAEGQLGAVATETCETYEKFVCATKPSRVLGELTTGHVREVSVGYTHSCAVSGFNIAYCWGDNSVGQVGANRDEATLPFPVRVAPPTPSTPNGHLLFGHLSVGGFSSCGRDHTGTTYCWGFNGLGQLGTGDKINRKLPVMVALFGRDRLREVSAGEAHTCGATQDNRTFCWGSNQYGQLGVGNVSTERCTIAVHYEVREVSCILRPRELHTFSFYRLSAGGHHTCALRTESGDAFCWGQNDFFQLGERSGSRDPRNTPVEVAPPFPSGR
jgi:alpha-tubulin suppressor-like RCC1 family protein